MKCDRKECRADMRPFYDEGGYVILGQECRRCGRALFTRDAGVAFQPPEGAVRRYTPAEVVELRELPRPALPQPPKRGGPKDPIECGCGCGVWFAPGPKQVYASLECRQAVARAKWSQTAATRKGLHDEPEFSASAQ